MGKQWKQCQTLFLWAPKSLHHLGIAFMGTAQHMNTDLCLNRSLEPEWLPGEACSLRRQALWRRSCWWQGCSEFSVSLHTHCLLSLLPLLLFSFLASAKQIYQLYILLSPGSAQILSLALFKKPQFPPSKVVPQELSFPHSANIPPKKSKLLCPTSLHWKPGKEGLNGSPGSLARGQGPHVFTLKSCFSEVAQSCPTLCDPMDCSLPSSSVHGIFQAILLE